MTHHLHLTLGRRSRAAASFAAIAALFLALATNVTAANATTNTRSDRICQTQTMAVTNASVYQVCLTATDSFNDAQASGYVAGATCNIYLPT
jgi:hypothetical protein